MSGAASAAMARTMIVNHCKQARLAALAAPDVPAAFAEQAPAVVEEAPAVAEELQDCRLSFSFQFMRGD